MLETIKKLKKEGKLNSYAFEKIAKHLAAPIDLQQKLVEEGLKLSALNISSEEDHKIYAYLEQFVKPIAQDISKKEISNKFAKLISQELYLNYKDKINSFLDLYCLTEEVLTKKGMIKKAYPSGQGGIFINPYNMEKWMVAMRHIYATTSKKYDFNQAFELVTQGWDPVEKLNFKNWIRFYQEGGHLKYKTAQSHYYQLNGDGPPMIPFDHLSAKLPMKNMPNMDMFEENKKIDDEVQKKKREEEANQKKSELRKKLISRLQSAERLITDPEVVRDFQNSLDIGLDKWLEILHSLKRSIQTAPMKSASSTILTDLIIREGNSLVNQGYPKSGKFLIKFAQEAPQAPTVEELREQETNQSPEQDPAPADNPLDQIPDLETPGSELPAMPDMLEPSEISDDDQAMKDFVRRMNNEFTADIQESDDELVVEAQLDLETLPQSQPEIEVSEEEDRGIVDNPVEILSNISMQSIIDRLEIIADILRKKEIPRQLAIVDLMMDEVGIIGFFPELAEAQKSSLDANQYMATRIDGVLSRLRTSVKLPQTVDLTSDEDVEKIKKEPQDAAIKSVRQNLQLEEEKAKAKKEQRVIEEENKEQQQQAIRQELATPSEIKKSRPIRVQ